jgi:hypothetical protein
MEEGIFPLELCLIEVPKRLPEAPIDIAPIVDPDDVAILSHTWLLC